MKKSQNFSLLFYFFMMFVFLTAVLSTPAQAAGQQPVNRTVKIGYPIQKGLTDMNEHGEYSGYTYEYLEEISQYTGWDYEFVQVSGNTNESLNTLLDMLAKGQIDLMGTMYYSKDLVNIYDYSGYSYGTAETVLQVLRDSPSEILINSQIEQHMKIAVIKTASRSLRELEEFCTMNLITPEYIFCDDTSDQLQTLKDGRADVMLGASMNYTEGIRTIASFSPKPFYFITTKGQNTGLIEELNGAIANIQHTNPYFSTALFEKYFTAPNNTLTLTAAENAYIKSTPKLKVGIMTNQPPFQFIDDDTNCGIAVGLLSYISNKTGLNFEFVPTSSYEELYSMASSHEVDLIAAMPYDYTLAKDQNLAMTRPYVSSQFVMVADSTVGNKNLSSKRVALTNYGFSRGMDLNNKVYYDSLDDCLRAVYRGDADYTYVDNYTAQYYTNLPGFQKFKLLPQASELKEMSFGITKPSSMELLNIFNKALGTISTEDMQMIIYHNTIYLPDFNLRYLIEKHPLGFFLSFAGFLLCIILLLLFVLRRQNRKKKKLALELEKHLLIYQLTNDYFFEYDYSALNLMVSLPADEGKTSNFITFSFMDAAINPEIAKRRDTFLNIITGTEDLSPEVLMHCTDNQDHWLRFIFQTIRDSSGSPVCTIGKISIIDEEKLEHDTLLEKAQHDSLTHLLNVETCSHIVSDKLKLLGEGDTGALLLIDIDNFKSINDVYGHLCGDRVLTDMAETLRRNFRSDDIIARPGGDEFVVYINSIDGHAALVERCNSLCQKIHNIKMKDGHFITISVGAAITTKGITYIQAYSLADSSLYDAKTKGRDCFVIS